MCVFPVQERTALVLRQEVKKRTGSDKQKDVEFDSEMCYKCGFSGMHCAMELLWQGLERRFLSESMLHLHGARHGRNRLLSRSMSTIGSLFTCSVPQYDVPLALAATWPRPYLLL